MPRPVSAPKEKIPARGFSLIRSQTLRQQFLIVCQNIQSSGVTSVSHTGHQSQAE